MNTNEILNCFDQGRYTSVLVPEQVFLEERSSVPGSSFGGKECYRCSAKVTGSGIPSRAGETESREDRSRALGLYPGDGALWQGWVFIVLIRYSRICGTIVESLPMARCAPKCEKTVQALLCRNLNVKSATLPNATSSCRIRLQDDLVTRFHFLVRARFPFPPVCIESRNSRTHSRDGDPIPRALDGHQSHRGMASTYQ
ncbi:hypothetical protein JRO89_XS10G0118400 [Xanthoceras sorbifolium]|uniref:ATP synthase protein MI25 n=1 Tax=Xanthoceras sorbifolium TaxID=99658 RepID=A0ABQ8HIC6_9ROSI|nr:hypothetical protein JRO89_XS10G0118400 [Xanthoceras sorbifolium]